MVSDSTPYKPPKPPALGPKVPTTRCAECGTRAWFIDGCPVCGRVTEVIRDLP
jgi:hypothetical protein